MKLSEAIRLGGMMKPQGRSSPSMISLDAPCALGGALQSIGKQPKKWRWHAPEGELWFEPTAISAMHVVADNWPFTLRPAECPCGSNHGICATQRTVANIIGVLNDHHRWTRNQIADWVETVEPAEEVEQGVDDEPQPDKKEEPKATHFCWVEDEYPGMKFNPQHGQKPRPE